MRLYPDSTEYTGPEATYESMRTPSLWESAKAGTFEAWTENRPLMSHLVDYGPDVTENLEQKLSEARKSGMIPEKVFDMFGDNFDEVSNWAHYQKMEGFQSNTQLQDARVAEHKTRKAEANRILEQSGWVGKTIGFGTGMATYLTEPLYVLPGLGAVSASATIGSVILRGAMVEAGAETFGLIPKWNRKDELRVKYDSSDMLLDVGFAAIGGGAFVGLGKGITRAAELSAGKMAKTLRGWEQMSPIGSIMRPARKMFEKVDAKYNAKQLLDEIDVEIKRMDSEGGVKSQTEKGEPLAQEAEVSSYMERRYSAITDPDRFAPGPAKVEPDVSGPPDKFQPDMPEGWDTRYLTERGAAEPPPTTKEASDALRSKMEADQTAKNEGVQSTLKDIDKTAQKRANEVKILLRKRIDDVEFQKQKLIDINDCLGAGGIT